MEADAKAALEVDRTGGVQRHGSPLTSLWPGLVQLWNNPNAPTCLHLRDPKRKERGALEKVWKSRKVGNTDEKYSCKIPAFRGEMDKVCLSG